VGGAVPGEADVDVTAPAIEGVLGDGSDLKPPQGRQMAARGFNPAAIDLKDLRDPRGFAPPSADTAQWAGVGIQTSDKVPEDGGNDGGPAAEGEQAKGWTGDGDPPLQVRERRLHSDKARAVGDATQGVRGSDKGDAGTRPRQQAIGFQATEGATEVGSTDPTNKPVELRQRIVRNLVRPELATARDHFLAGEPDAQIPELDVPLPIDPPQEAEDLDGQQHKAPMRLPRRACSVYDCGRWHGSVSLVVADSPQVSAVPCESSTTRDLAQKIPVDSRFRLDGRKKCS
jgi:hypothetical protein